MKLSIDVMLSVHKKIPSQQYSAVELILSKSYKKGNTFLVAVLGPFFLETDVVVFLWMASLFSALIIWENMETFLE